MIGFLRRLFGGRPRESASGGRQHTDSFVDATGGGWTDIPDVVAADGGSNRDYVTQQLSLAQQQARSYNIGESFTYRLTDIPAGIQSPHEIVFGMMMRASEFGLVAGAMADEVIEFTRTS